MLEMPVEIVRRNHAYPICIGALPEKGLAAEIERRVPADSYVAVIDSRVMQLHFPEPGKVFGPNWRRYRVEAGEEHKNATDFISLVEKILQDGIDRKTVVVAIGGGVTGDLAGFAAATLLRGVRLVQVPTTLLAQVDSSVGGKTGINMAGGKNLLGAFYQPELVVAAPSFLTTLSAREYASGLAEVIKYGVICDRRFFDDLIGKARGIADRDSQTLTEIVAHCCKMKAQVVGSDEKESNQRQLLNLGHTFGHALEALAGYDGTLLHGEAVALGMVLAASFSVNEEMMTREEEQGMRKGFAALGLPCELDDMEWTEEKRTEFEGLLESTRLNDALLMDKKAAEGGLTLILPVGIGECKIVKNVSVDKVAEHIRARCKSALS